MIARNNLLWKSYLVALISTRGMTLDKLLLPPSSSVLQYQESGGSLVSAIA